MEFVRTSINFTDTSYTNTTERSRMDGSSHPLPTVLFPSCPSLATATKSPVSCQGYQYQHT
jgi:hypothetical protein